MSDQAKVTEQPEHSDVESDNATPDETQTPEFEAIQKQLDDLKAERDRLLDKVKTHGKEMKLKKEREKAALEEAEKLAKEKGDYEKAMELHAKQVEMWQAEKSEWDQQRAQFAQARKQDAVKMALMQDGILNKSVPVDDAIKFLNLDEIELDDNGKPANWDTHLKALFTGRDYLKPKSPGVGAGTGPVGEGGTSNATNEARIVAANSGGTLTPEAAQEMLTNDIYRKQFEARGWLKPPPNVKRYVKG